MKITCLKCKLEKPDTDFYIIRMTGKIRRYCKPCCKIISANNYLRFKESRKLQNTEYRNRPGNLERQRQRVRNWHYKKHYGLSEYDKQKIQQDQGNRCAICSIHFEELSRNRVHVDHCHLNNKIRGILCFNCNHLVGHAKNDEGILRKAIIYLRRFNVTMEHRSCAH